jgi:hypothetical protein
MYNSVGSISTMAKEKKREKEKKAVYGFCSLS